LSWLKDTYSVVDRDFIASNGNFITVDTDFIAGDGKFIAGDRDYLSDLLLAIAISSQAIICHFRQKEFLPLKIYLREAMKKYCFFMR